MQVKACFKLPVIVDQSDVMAPAKSARKAASSSGQFSNAIQNIFEAGWGGARGETDDGCQVVDYGCRMTSNKGYRVFIYQVLSWHIKCKGPDDGWPMRGIEFCQVLSPHDIVRLFTQGTFTGGWGKSTDTHDYLFVNAPAKLRNHRDGKSTVNECRFMPPNIFYTC